MTYKNRKFRYDTYIERGMTKEAKAISDRFPDVLEKSFEGKEETKSKGKK